MVEILKNIKPIARKEHKCMFCGGIIKIGEKYDRQTCVYDGAAYDWINHHECSIIAHKLDMYDGCDEGLNDEGFIASIQKYVYDNHYDDGIDDIAKDWQLPYYDTVKKILEELQKQENNGKDI